MRLFSRAPVGARLFIIARPCRASFRDAVSFRQRLPRRAQMRPPRNDTKSGRFFVKTYHFFNQKIEICRGATPRKIACIKQKRTFPKQKRSKSVSLRGRIAAVAIFKPRVWHPVAKQGSGKRKKFQILNRRGATPPRRFSGSAVSRGSCPLLHFTLARLVQLCKYCFFSVCTMSTYSARQSS